MTKITNLKPCPFCGSDAELNVENDHHGYFFTLGCKDNKCLAHWACYTSPMETLDDAVNRWNTRATNGQNSSTL